MTLRMLRDNLGVAAVAASMAVHAQLVFPAFAQTPPSVSKVASPPPAARVPYSNYAISKPCAGSATMPVWTRGTTVNIVWTGGPPGAVRVLLVDYCGWAVNSVIATATTNTHSCSYTIPNTLACGIYCVCVQNDTGPLTFWAYSCNVAITKP